MNFKDFFNLECRRRKLIDKYIRLKKGTLRKKIINHKLRQNNIFIHENAVIGEGTFFVHPNNINIGANCVIGKNCRIYHNVTIGAKDNLYPFLEDGCIIYAGAILIGGITIGKNCTIGAGSVVVKSFEDNSVVAGNPAHLIRGEKV